MMQFHLADEYEAVWSAYGYDLETMEQLSLDAVAASFAPDDEKAALRSRFLGDFDALRAEFGVAARAARPV